MGVLIFDYEFALESCKKNEVSQVSTSQVIGQNTIIQDSLIISISVRNKCP